MLYETVLSVDTLQSLCPTMPLNDVTFVQLLRDFVSGATQRVAITFVEDHERKVDLDITVDFGVAYVPRARISLALPSKQQASAETKFACRLRKVRRGGFHVHSAKPLNEARHCRARIGHNTRIVLCANQVETDFATMLEQMQSQLLERIGLLEQQLGDRIFIRNTTISRRVRILHMDKAKPLPLVTDSIPPCCGVVYGCTHAVNRVQLGSVVKDIVRVPENFMHKAQWISSADATGSDWTRPAPDGAGAAQPAAAVDLVYLPPTTTSDDLAPLGLCDDLTELALFGKGIAHLDFLHGVPTLQRLVLMDTAVTSLEPLSRLTALTELVLQDSAGVTDLRPLVGLARLAKLDLRGTAVQAQNRLLLAHNTSLIIT